MSPACKRDTAGGSVTVSTDAGRLQRRWRTPLVAAPISLRPHLRSPALLTLRQHPQCQHQHKQAGNLQWLFWAHLDG